MPLEVFGKCYRTFGQAVTAVMRSGGYSKDAASAIVQKEAKRAVVEERNEPNHFLALASTFYI